MFVCSGRSIPNPWRIFRFWTTRVGFSYYFLDCKRRTECIYWNILQCSRIFQYILVYSRVFKNVRKYSRMLMNLPEGLRMFHIVLECFRKILNIPKCSTFCGTSFWSSRFLATRLLRYYIYNSSYKILEEIDNMALTRLCR